MATNTYDVTVVKYGTRSTRRSEVFLNYGVYGEPDGPLEMDYFFWLVRSVDSAFLVDTGFSARGGAVRKRTSLIDPVHALGLLGVTPPDAPTLVLTHAHYDHIGNLRHFPASHAVMARSEFEFWAGPDADHAQYRHSIERDELATLRRTHDEGRLQLFDGELGLAPGIRLIEVGGHTPGQLVVLVDTADGTVLLASDAVHYYEEVEKDYAFAVLDDLRKMYRAFGLVRELVDGGDVRHVVSGHDPATFDRFPPATEGELAGLAATIGAVR